MAQSSANIDVTRLVLTTELESARALIAAQAKEIARLNAALTRLKNIAQSQAKG